MLRRGTSSKIRILSFTAIILILTVFVSAGELPEGFVYQDHSLLYIEKLDPNQLPEFYRGGFDVARRYDDGSMDIVATPRERDILVNNFGANVKIENIEEYNRQRLDPNKTMGGFHTYDEAYGELYFIAYLNPGIAHLDTIGYSLQGRPIYALKISDNPEIDEEDETEVFFNGMIHAREPIGMEILLYTINHLLDNREDPEIAELINENEIWFVPIINPDGYVLNEDISPSGGGMWRKNLRDNGDGSFGVDLNRNWGFIWGIDDNSSSPDGESQVYRGTAPFSEPETQVLRDFINSRDFPFILNIHAYGDYYIYPFSAPNIQGSPDILKFVPVADSIFNLNGLPTPFFIGDGLGGGANGWQYAEQVEKPKVFSLLVEVGTWFWPATEEILPICELHLPSNLYFIRMAQQLRRRPSRSLATEFAYFDSTVNGCSPDFSRTVSFWNRNDTASFTVDINYIDDTPTPGWFSVTPSSELVNPGDTFSVDLNFSPANTAGIGNYYRPVGFLELILTNQGNPPMVDTLYFHASFTVEIDDSDEDGYDLCFDNCADIPNPEQTDTDTDGFGDACDNCPDDYNTEQVDTDSDGAGDLCDICPGFDDFSDVDLDGIPDGCDNCPDKYNPDQADEDENGTGDICDYLCGDPNGDEAVNLGDASFIINYIFYDGPEPDPLCAGDCNGDETTNLADASYIINYIFYEGPLPLETCCP